MRIRGTRTPRSASRRYPPPTTCSRTRRSARSTTRSGAWSRRVRSRVARVGRGDPAASGPAGSSSTTRSTSVTCSVGCSAGAADAAAEPVPAGASARHAPQRGADLETELTIEFLDAIEGITTSVAFTAEAACSECKATGAAPGTSPRVCTECGGRGEIAMNQGLFSTSQVCPVCHGRGAVIPDPCPRCHGGGTEVRRREVKVEVAGRGQGRSAHQGRQAGRGGSQWRAGRRSVRGGARCDRTRSSVGRARAISPCIFRSRSRRRPSAPRSRCRRSPTR